MATLAHSAVDREHSLAGVPMPATLRSVAPFTDEEVMAFSQQNEGFQIERNAEGDLEIMSPEGLNSARLAAYAIRVLGTWADEHGGITLGSDGGMTLPDGSLRSPDAAWILESRWNALSRKERLGFAPLCPDFLVEILSPSDSRARLERKMQMWIANGAKLAWMIDPFRQTLSIYRPGMDAEVLDRPASVEAGEPIPGFRLPALPLWQD